VLNAVSQVGATATAVVVGPNNDTVASEAKQVLRDAGIFVQAERRRTAHAVLAARDAIARA
jgi:bifunctional UDP-N-acetylglucosamine pyrophosphorylase/glucosamine-1-phosphate N-acetyltransferase